MRKVQFLMTSMIAGFLVSKSHADQAPAPDTVRVNGSTAPVASTPVAPIKRQTSLNEIKGKFQSSSDDPRTIRLISESGFNVEFPYDTKTTVFQGENRLTVKELNYNDEVAVRYAGKELYAIEVERLSHAARPN